MSIIIPPRWTVVLEHEECGEFWWHVEAMDSTAAVLAASRRMRNDGGVTGKSVARAVFPGWLENRLTNPKAIAINRMEPTV